MRSVLLSLGVTTELPCKAGPGPVTRAKLVFNPHPRLSPAHPARSHFLTCPSRYPGGSPHLDCHPGTPPRPCQSAHETGSSPPPSHQHHAPCVPCDWASLGRPANGSRGPSLPSRVHVSTLPASDWAGRPGASDGWWLMRSETLLRVLDSIWRHKFWAVFIHFQFPFSFCLKRSFPLLSDATPRRGLLRVSAFSAHC